MSINFNIIDRGLHEDIIHDGVIIAIRSLCNLWISPYGFPDLHQYDTKINFCILHAVTTRESSELCYNQYLGPGKFRYVVVIKSGLDCPSKDDPHYKEKILELSMMLKHKHDMVSIDFESLTDHYFLQKYNYVGIYGNKLRVGSECFDNSDFYKMAEGIVFHRSELVNDCIPLELIDEKVSKYMHAFINAKPHSMKRAIN